MGKQLTNAVDRSMARASLTSELSGRVRSVVSRIDQAPPGMMGRVQDYPPLEEIDQLILVLNSNLTQSTSQEIGDALSYVQVVFALPDMDPLAARAYGHTLATIAPEFLAMAVARVIATYRYPSWPKPADFLSAVAAEQSERQAQLSSLVRVRGKIAYLQKREDDRAISDLQSGGDHPPGSLRLVPGSSPRARNKTDQ